MVNVVQFKPKESERCRSPIIVDRIGTTIVAVDFHKAYFDIPLLENALQNVAYGEIWDLCKARDDNSPYASYRVVLRQIYRDRANEVLAGAVEKIARRAYLEQIQVWNDDFDIEGLTKPHCYTINDGVSVYNKTTRKLLSAGIKTARDLTNSTREQICMIPGMTTEEVVGIEKSLASRGLFLITTVPTIS